MSSGERISIVVPTHALKIMYSHEAIWKSRGAVSENLSSCSFHAISQPWYCVSPWDLNIAHNNGGYTISWQRLCKID